MTLAIGLKKQVKLQLEPPTLRFFGIEKDLIVIAAITYSGSVIRTKASPTQEWWESRTVVRRFASRRVRFFIIHELLKG